MKFFYKHDKWTLADTIWQIIFVILLIINWGQGRFAAAHPLTWKETNPLLNPHQSLLSVDVYCGICFIGNMLIPYLLPKKWRRGWQIIGTVAQFYCVFWAFYDGVGVNFKFFQY
ncbi:MAG TPA: hypothetical protein DDW65_21710 [Firmicutes bacterium]|jgi:hypothetical protein|nr:hypothetical protein [Bacillota bacterium]